MYNVSGQVVRTLLSMNFRFLVRSLIAFYSLFVVQTSALGKTEAECLDAIKAGNELIQKNPNDYSGYASRGCGYEYLKKYDLAEKDLLKAISLRPDLSGLYGHLAFTCYETKRFEKAAVASRKAFELGAKGQSASNALLANLCMARHFEECLERCNEVISIFPNNGVAFYYRAICRNELAAASKEQILADLDKAKSLCPENVSIKELYTLAKAGKSIKLKYR